MIGAWLAGGALGRLDRRRRRVDAHQGRARGPGEWRRPRRSPGHRDPCRPGRRRVSTGPTNCWRPWNRPSPSAPPPPRVARTDPARRPPSASPAWPRRASCSTVRGRPIGEIMAWFDPRPAPQAEWLERRIGAPALFARTGLRPEPKYTLPKLMWLREERAAGRGPVPALGRRGGTGRPPPHRRAGDQRLAGVPDRAPSPPPRAAGMRSCSASPASSPDAHARGPAAGPLAGRADAVRRGAPGLDRRDAGRDRGPRPPRGRPRGGRHATGRRARLDGQRRSRAPRHRRPALQRRVAPERLLLRLPRPGRAPGTWPAACRRPAPWSSGSSIGSWRVRASAATAPPRRRPRLGPARRRRPRRPALCRVPGAPASAPARIPPGRLVRPYLRGRTAPQRDLSAAFDVAGLSETRRPAGVGRGPDRRRGLPRPLDARRARAPDRDSARARPGHRRRDPQPALAGGQGRSRARPVRSGAAPTRPPPWAPLWWPAWPAAYTDR